MVHCCVPGCKNTHHNKHRKDEWGGGGCDRNYSLHDLPNEDRMDIRELWIMAINRTSLPKDVAVCSDHFTEDCFDEKWEEYKRKYGPTKVKRKLKVDAIPTVFPGRLFVNEKVQQIKNNWKNKVLQKTIEMEKLRLEREYKDRFKYTQTECECKCRCRLRRKHFTQQVNFQFKFMEDIGVQFPEPSTTEENVKEDHTYNTASCKGTVICKETGKPTATVTIGGITTIKSKNKNKEAADSSASTGPGEPIQVPLIKNNASIDIGLSLPTPANSQNEEEHIRMALKRKIEDETIAVEHNKQTRLESRRQQMMEQHSIGVSTD